jgi:hypothetical protein
MDETLFELFLRRKNKLAVPEPEAGAAAISPDVLASGLKNLEVLGYGIDSALLAALQPLGQDQFVKLYNRLVEALKKLRGAHREFKPLYPGFPKEVMKLDEAQLYLNAVLHYITDGAYRPANQNKKTRKKLSEEPPRTVLSLGTESELFGLIGPILSGNASLSETDKADIAALLTAAEESALDHFPEAIPQKENAALAVALAIRQLQLGEAAALALAECYLKTATDALRLAVALSGGDLSLATPTKFTKLSRAQRRVILGLVERAQSREEDMKLWAGRWLRLGERLHPGELSGRFPKTAEAFQKLRNDLPIATFGSAVEGALRQKNVAAALAVLITRPGELARRLDHLLRLDDSRADAILGGFAEVAPRVSTPVLLQVRAHFAARPSPAPLRVFLPKGQVAKAKSIDFNLPPLEQGLCERVVQACEAALKERFAALEPLGTVYLDPKLKAYNLPFGMRSASKALRTVARGSRLPLPDAETLRLFCWWKNGIERTDIDLSATLFGEDFSYIDAITFYNLKSQGGVHSGDIVDAPDGACEFIDLYRSILKQRGVRYVVMVLQSYTRQPYIELPECFAGWMAREKKNKGQIFEPRTVQDRLDITSDARAAIPLVIDLVDEYVLWSDLALKSTPNFQNTVAANLGGIAATLQGLTVLRKPDIYSLLKLHAEARGRLVDSPDGADTVFSVEAGTPYALTELAASYMA